MISEILRVSPLFCMSCRLLKAKFIANLDHTPVEPIEDPEEHLARDGVVDCGGDESGLDGHELLATEGGDFAVEGVPAISGAGGGVAWSGDAALGIVEVAMISGAKSGRGAGFAGWMDEGAQGDHDLPPIG